MNYELVTELTLKSSDCFVLGVLDDKKYSNFIANLPSDHQHLVEKLSNRLEEAGDYVWQMDVDGHSLMILHCGKQEQFTSEVLRKRIKELAANLLKHRFKSATLALPKVTDLNPNQQLERMILDFDSECYQLLDYKSKEKKPYALKEVTFYCPNAQSKTVKEAAALSEGIRLCKTLANTPSNVCTPSYLAENAMEFGNKHRKVSVKIVEKQEMQELGMGALLAVAQGSVEPPKLVEVHYHGGGDQAPIILVGKGITFDSGGLSLKPSEAMTEMKYDMTGAAAVLGTLKACSLLELPINVIGLLACAENMPSGHAVKPGDVVTSLSGQTIEILNTDAEGRLVLADALTYAEQYKPQLVLDIATLTGAMIIALGSVYTGFMTTDDDLAKLIETAAKESLDKAWRLPLDDVYQKAMDSQVADMINAAFDRSASSITAACFLSRFTKNFRWAHLDIAGSAWISGKKCDATGRPVPLLTQILRHVAAR
ncbi:leucyl aminopeptidase [Legionella impletisoli]|uniref:Probable cytosol aminopeptidase n=1 Tax=Legionella impletisoli TaxID=343510 RepID=A0A917JWW4_9GAMM|nr:leucyl aminopeptidase [Legionella impletisoli]GGI85904.1 putative cytosol aminopeptidase [Legionella impletisoli]